MYVCFFATKKKSKQKKMEQEKIYDPRREKSRTQILPDARNQLLFDEGEGEEGSGKDEEAADNVLAQAQRTSRLEGSTIVYEQQWKRFQDRSGSEIAHDLNPDAQFSDAQKDRLDRDKERDMQKFKKRKEIEKNPWRRFIDRICGLSKVRPQDVYNPARLQDSEGNPENPRTMWELPTTMGIEDINFHLTAHIEEAFDLVRLRIPHLSALPDMEAIVFSDDTRIITLFARLVWVRMRTSGYFTDSVPRLESELRSLRQQEHFILRAMSKFRWDSLQSKFIAEGDAEPDIPYGAFPRTMSGYKRPRY